MAKSATRGSGATLVARRRLVFVLDNYASFTYNLVQYMGELGAEMTIRRNDEVTPEEVEALRPDRIPGRCGRPGTGPVGDRRERDLVPIQRGQQGGPVSGIGQHRRVLAVARGGRVRAQPAQCDREHHRGPIPDKIDRVSVTDVILVR